MLLVGPCPRWAEAGHTDWREPMSTVSFVERLDLREKQKETHGTDTHTKTG